MSSLLIFKKWPKLYKFGKLKLKIIYLTCPVMFIYDHKFKSRFRDVEVFQDTHMCHDAASYFNKLCLRFSVSKKETYFIPSTLLRIFSLQYIWLGNLLI